ncbi:TPA: HAD-IIA family hydrolase [Bacillus paranthracis]
MNVSLNGLSVYIFDLDGCIYSGQTLYPGAKELIETLMKHKKKIYFLTNNSRDTSETIRKKLYGMGLDIKKAPVITMTEIIGKYLYEKFGRLKVIVIGSQELELSIKSEGHYIVNLNSNEPCDFIVVGRDTEFTYEKLYKCSQQLKGATKLVLTNPDLHHPGLGGENVPETGALFAAIQAVSELTDVDFVGKPNSYPYQYILQHSNETLDQCVMIGDNPLTDIQGGFNVGLKTIWISHSKAFPKALEFQPDLTVKTIEHLKDLHIKEMSL